MNITGVIAEYNIFHNGHKYQIDEIKKQSDAVVAIMSGSFVQRGDVALTDKWSRAKMALLGGVDLVLELPTCYALNAAQNFATGAVNSLDALGVIDNLCFGSESGDIENLYSIATLLENESDITSQKIKQYVNEGMSYASALTKAYSADICEEILKKPNNILALEYIRALLRTNSNIKPITIKRSGAMHDDVRVHGKIASASKIRDMFKSNEKINDFVPYSIDDINCDMPYNISELDNAIISTLRRINTYDLKNISEVSEGIENRILSYVKTSYSFDMLAQNIKSKRYTLSKIRRIIIASLIGFTRDIYSPKPDYIRVLGMNTTGMKILKLAKEVCTVPIITKVADFKATSEQFELDKRATDISMLTNPIIEHRFGNLDFKNSPIIVR